MTKNISASFVLEQKQSDMIEKKLDRIKYADELINDLTVRVKQEKEYESYNN